MKAETKITGETSSGHAGLASQQRVECRHYEHQQAIRARCYHPTGTFVEFPIEDVETSIPARFEKIARLHPDRIAVKTQSQSVTYNQLNEMANRLAHDLMQRLGRKTQLVVILLEKDVAQVAAMLGVLKAGKFFLILDPSFPNTRLSTMLKDSRAKLVVTNRLNAALADEIATADCTLMRWDAMDGSFRESNPELSIAPKALAFINYTSGSTGEPKGLLFTHRMILHNIMLRTNLIHVSEHDRISLLSSGTSNAITNSFLALLNGAGLYSIEVKREGAARLASWLAEQKITITPISSSLFRVLCGSLKEENNFPDLRVVRLRSESVYTSDSGLYKRYFSQNCIFVTGLSSNETGPLTDYLIDRDTAVTDDDVPIGYEVPGKEVRLLNEEGEELGHNAVGEITVRSRYLSPGYLRNSQLTRSKFKRDPFEPGGRLYLTGDLGLMLPNGCVVHKGRKDFRVKVRGYPVDLKEVEIALRSHPLIHDAVITARRNQSGETSLVAYFVTVSSQVPTVSELKRFLGQTLPDYMIPAAFVKLDSMPLNPQNKVDRAVLPPPADTRPDLDTVFMTPRRDEERNIAEIWAEVLGIDRIGIRDNFFDLGGHSLAATRIVTRVSEKFHLELPVQLLFDSPTVEKMAAAINQAGHGPGNLRAQPSNDTAPARSESIVGFVPFPKEEVELSVAERFEKIVRLFPNRIAVKTGDDLVTYSQLNSMANRMAREIAAQLGTEPEAVAILMNNGAPLMGAMLAVLKAGKFFVLLDKSSPKTRLINILEASQARVIVSERAYSEVTRHLVGSDSHILDFDSIAYQAPQENLCLNISPESLAAIIYTSGSAGEPKGVIWAQRNLLHQVMLFTNAYKLSERDRVLLTTASTGNAVTIGFLALLNGASLLPFDVQMHRVNHLVRWIQHEKITICWLGSPLFRNICHFLNDNEKFHDVRILRLASEASYKSDIDLYKKHFLPECQLINGLSNTESGLICLYRIDSNPEIIGPDVPVGYSVEDKEVLLLDDSGKEVGFHEVGEIAIRSGYLSPGYWRRPELTATKFKADPDNRHQRIYFSGDLGVRLPDGCLIHKGRRDFRVKIRGYGVEPAEVEKALKTHPAIGQVAVLGQVQESGEARLVAYCTWNEASNPTVSQLRAFLRKQLADYMIPSTFVMVDELPLTPSGKVNRRALPDPDNSRPTLSIPYLSSRTEIEEELVTIWEDTLNVRPIGVHDGFFDLGGDSLSATRLISQVIKHFQLEIPLEELFRSPTVADMAEQVAQHQGKLSWNDKVVQTETVSSIHEFRHSSLPLSFSQQRLWFLDQLDPGNFTHNLFAAYRLKGDLKVAALEQSFNEIIRRHEVLRTVFRSHDGSPVQVVLPSLAIEMPSVDLRGLASEKARWTETRRMFRQEAQRPFDLSTGPLLRIMLVQLADDEYVMLRAMHHIVSDGWSGGILFRELSELYNVLSTGQQSPLAELPIQYADYARWQRYAFEGARLGAQLSYWKKQLRNIAPLDLPTDRPRQALQVRCGGRRYFSLSDGLSSALKELSRAHGTTLFMTILAAYQTLLHRYSHQTDITIGSPVAGRTRKDFDELIGFFLNMLVLRLDLSGNPTFAETMARVRELCLGALSHQELPFEKLVEEMHPERNLGQNPFFQVTFAFQNTPRVSPQLSGVEVEELEVETGIARFDLHLFMEERAGHLQGYCDYDTGLFREDTIERMLGHFQTLLQGIVAKPDEHISDLPLLTQAEKEQLLAECNHAGRDYPKAQCIHQIFEHQVEKTPDAVALILAERRLSYRELNDRANQLAHYLRKLGVGPDVLVGLCAERSIEMIVAILAILKAGGAYVPLDPAYPQERLAFMVGDSRVPVLITQSILLARLPPHNAKVLCLDRDWSEIAAQSRDDPSPLAKPDNLAYVIYTSGSTGAPKGVLIPHHNVVRLFKVTDRWFHFSPDDVWTLFHSYAFDFSVWELWGALIHGGRLVIVPFDISRSPRDFHELLCREQVTILNQTPSAFRQLMQVEESILDSNRLALRVVIFGGETLDFQNLKPWFQRHGDQKPRLVNMYGITETTVHVTYRVVTQDDVIAGVTNMIGGPVPDLELYVLDTYRNLVPIGIPGELYVGGAGVAMGYLNRGELTAERFVDHPFASGEGRRLYRSGDLVRRRADGDIEYLGRIDNQVKIRGFRIELGEIESVLAQHPAIQQAVVLAREDALGEKRLAAYVVAALHSAPTMSELRSFLRQKLPEPMVPSTINFLDSLPLGPNGKIDRKGLPAPDQSGPELDKPTIVARDKLELQLTEVWKKILGKKSIGVTDNFFDAGGHSLLTVQLFAEIEKTMGRHLPLATIFQKPTIEQLANILRQQEWSGSQDDLWLNYPSSVVPFQTNGSNPPLFWLNWGPWDFRLPRYLGSDQPVYGLQHQSQDGHRALYASIEDMAEYYIKELRAIRPKGPYFLGGLCIGGMIVFEMARQLKKQGDDVALLVLLDPTNPRTDELLSAKNAVPGLLSNITRFRNKVSRHLRELKSLEPQERLDYALVRVQARVMGIREKINWVARRFLCEALEVSLPLSLRRHYIASIYAGAARAYVPQHYRGRVILFKTQGRYRSRQSLWERLITGELKIQELDTDHDHVFTEPYVRTFAETLSARLSEARTHVNKLQNPNASSHHNLQMAGVFN